MPGARRRGRVPGLRCVAALDAACFLLGRSRASALPPTPSTGRSARPPGTARDRGPRRSRPLPSSGAPTDPRRRGLRLRRHPRRHRVADLRAGPRRRRRARRRTSPRSCGPPTPSGRPRTSPGGTTWRPLLGLSIDQAAFDEAVEAVTHIPTAFESAEITPGADPLVRALAATDARLAVASGSSRDWVDHHLARFGLTSLLPTVVGRDHPRGHRGQAGAGPLPRGRRRRRRRRRARGRHRGHACGASSRPGPPGWGRSWPCPSRLTAHQDLSDRRPGRGLAGRAHPAPTWPPSSRALSVGWPPCPSRSVGSVACAAPRPCAGWWPRPASASTTWSPRCSCGRASTSRTRSAPCPAWCSTPGPALRSRGRRACATWACRPVILFGVPGAQGRRGVGRLGPRRHRPGGPPATCATTSATTSWSWPTCASTSTPTTATAACSPPTGDVDNDATLERYAEVAVAQAEAGVDVVAPSGMMDGQVLAIRDALDEDGHEELADPGLRGQVRLRRSTARSARRSTSRSPTAATAGPTSRTPATSARRWRRSAPTWPRAPTW